MVGYKRIQTNQLNQHNTYQILEQQQCSETMVIVAQFGSRAI